MEETRKAVKIIAVDFDGCLVTNKYPEVGEPILNTILKLNKEQAEGARVILWTCRTEDKLDDALAFCEVYNIHLDAVNENLPEITEAFDSESRKIFANEYWDDRAVLMAEMEMDIGNFSDGYHTFNELYNQRMILSAALFNQFPDISWKSRKHHDGELCFGGGWFIVGIDTPRGQYTYHYKDEFWDLFNCKELEVSKEWDGHTDKDVDRLLSLCRVLEHKNLSPFERYMSRKRITS